MGGSVVALGSWVEMEVAWSAGDGGRGFTSKAFSMSWRLKLPHSAPALTASATTSPALANVASSQAPSTVPATSYDSARLSAVLPSRSQNRRTRSSGSPSVCGQPNRLPQPHLQTRVGEVRDQVNLALDRARGRVRRRAEEGQHRVRQVHGVRAGHEDVGSKVELASEAEEG